jgi:hypothetical protein
MKTVEQEKSAKRLIHIINPAEAVTVIPGTEKELARIIPSK